MLRTAEGQPFLLEIGHKVDLFVFPREFKVLGNLRLLTGAGRVYMVTALAALGGAGFEMYQNFTGKTPTVEADDPACRIRQLAVFGFEFVDNPLRANRPGLIDPADYIVGASEFGQAVVRTQETEFRGSMIVKGDHAEVIFKNLEVKPNTKGQNGKAAVEARVSFPEDKVRQAANSALQPEKDIVIECGADGVAWGGRYASEVDINTEAKNAKGINTVGARIDQLMEQLFGKGRKFGLTPQGDNPQQNLKNLKDNLENTLKHAQEVREEESKKAITLTPTATPTTTRTATATRTSTTPTTAPAKAEATAPAKVVTKDSTSSGNNSGFPTVATGVTLLTLLGAAKAVSLFVFKRRGII